eukprot:scaffold276_cov132-Cylindrotheca_fusiformis.AAC.20
MFDFVLVRRIHSYAVVMGDFERLSKKKAHANGKSLILCNCYNLDLLTHPSDCPAPPVSMIILTHLDPGH